MLAFSVDEMDPRTSTCLQFKWFHNLNAFAYPLHQNGNYVLLNVQLQECHTGKHSHWRGRQLDPKQPWRGWGMPTQRTQSQEKGTSRPYSRIQVPKTKLQMYRILEGGPQPGTID